MSPRLAINKGLLLLAVLTISLCPVKAQQVTPSDSNVATRSQRDAVLYSSSDIRFSPNVAKAPVYGPLSLSARDTAQRLDYHMSLFTGFYSGWGQTHGYAGAAPSFSYRLDDRWTLKAGFAITTDMVGNTYAIRESDGRSWAPRRHATTTGAVGMDVAAEYRPNDRTMVAAHFYYLGGSYTPVWSVNNRPEDLSVWGGSMEFHYRTKNDNMLSLYFNVMNDKTGALYPWLYHPGAGCRPGFMLHDDPWQVY